MAILVPPSGSNFVNLISQLRNSAPGRVAGVLWIPAATLPSCWWAAASKYQAPCPYQGRRPHPNEEDRGCSLFLHSTIRHRGLRFPISKFAAKLGSNGDESIATDNPAVTNHASVPADAVTAGAVNRPESAGAVSAGAAGAVKY